MEETFGRYDDLLTKETYPTIAFAGAVAASDSAAAAAGESDFEAAEAAAEKSPINRAVIEAEPRVLLPFIAANLRPSSPRSPPPPLPAEGGAHRRRSEPGMPPHSPPQPPQSLPPPALRLSRMTAASESRPKAHAEKSNASEPSSAMRGRGTALRPLAPPTGPAKRDTPQQRARSLPRPLGPALSGPAARQLATAADEAAAAPRATGPKLVPRSLRPRPGISEAPSTPRTPYTPRGGVTALTASTLASTDRGAMVARDLSATVALRRGISSRSVRPGMELNI
jgi:hypothetical protein